MKANRLGGIQHPYGFYSDRPSQTEVHPIAHSLDSDHNDEPYKVRSQRQGHGGSADGEENCLVYLDVVLSDAFKIGYGDEKKA